MHQDPYSNSSQEQHLKGQVGEAELKPLDQK